MTAPAPGDHPDSLRAPGSPRGVSKSREQIRFGTGTRGAGEAVGTLGAIRSQESHTRNSGRPAPSLASRACLTCLTLDRLERSESAVPRLPDRLEGLAIPSSGSKGSPTV